MHYTLQDRIYFDTLKVLTDEFSRQGLSYALVGGAGIQARIAHMLCLAQGTDIPGAVGLEHLLRETRDFDITSTAPEESFVKYFNELQALHPHISIHPERTRSKRLMVDDGKDKSAIIVNYQTGPQDLSGLDESFYHECIDTAKPLTLGYRGTSLTVAVATPECLITSKLTRYDAKDVWDIGTLLRTMKRHRQCSGKLNEEKIRTYLKLANKEEIFGRINEIRKQILKE